MPVALNHTIVAAHDAEESAAFLSEVLGLPAPERLFHFVMVETSNGVSLDYAAVAPGDDVATQHYAFLVSEQEFDEIFGRILDRDLDHWADPQRSQPGRINHHDGGRGVYFPDPSGHLLEIITRPYGSGS
jgi:catechol 2,3-dioxygenase-like lactoylglutathione lyase family enzyme